MIVARAPLRISLGGGGTDLPSYYREHGSFILSAAIDKYVYIILNRSAADALLRVKYSQYEEVYSVDQIRHDLVRPALKLLDIQSNLEIASMADVPDGTGLGSSGSYVVALLLALHELKRERVSKTTLAELAVHIEMDLASHAVGKQDHYLAAFGGITCLDIAQNGTVQVQPLGISATDLEEFRNRMVLFFTGLTRSSRGILQDQADGTIHADPTVLASLHRTKELGYLIRDALERGEVDRFGQLLDEHWQTKKCRSSVISHPAVDRWYGVARASGALGGKLIGAGSGGFLMLCCADGAKRAVRKALTGEGLREMEFGFDNEGAKVLVNF